MHGFAFSYYVGMLILVFILYASFLRAIVNSFRCWLIGSVAGATVIFMLLFAIYVACNTNGKEE